MCVRAQPLQSCPTLRDPVDYSPPSSSVHGIFRVRILDGLPFSPSGDFSHPVIKPTSPVPAALAAGSLPLSQLGSPSDYSALTLFTYWFVGCIHTLWMLSLLLLHVPYIFFWFLPCLFYFTIFFNDIFLLGESHGRRSLVGYRPRGCKESETTLTLPYLA